MEVIQTNFEYRNPLIPLNLTKVLFLIVHHTACETASPEQIHKWHLENGWSGFGYNEYIRKDGNVYIGRGYNIGAQTANMNSKSYGICLEGDFNKETIIHMAQFKSLISRLKYNKKKFPNLIDIAPHSRFAKTECPGKHISIDYVIREVNNINFDFDWDLTLLINNDIINSKEYWLEHAQESKTVKGEYAKILISNMAKKLRGE